MSDWGPQPPPSQLSQYLNSHHGHFQSRMLGLGFFNSSFHKMGAFQRNIPTVMFIFLNPCPQGGWELLLDLPELGRFPIPSIPHRSCLHPIPVKAPEAGETWIQVPVLPLRPWPWPTPAPSPSVFTRTMRGGAVTRSFLPLHGLQLLPNPKATQYFIVQTHGRATGQDRGTGGKNNGYSRFCFVF